MAVQYLPTLLFVGLIYCLISATATIKPNASFSSDACMINASLPETSNFGALHASVVSTLGAHVDGRNAKFVAVEAYVLEISTFGNAELLEAIEASLNSAATRGRTVVLRVFLDHNLSKSRDTMHADNSSAGPTAWDEDGWLLIQQAISVISSRYDTDRRLSAVELGFLGPFGLLASAQEASGIHRLLRMHAQAWRHTAFVVPAVVLPLLDEEERYWLNNNSTLIRMAPHQWRFASDAVLSQASIFLDGSTLNMSALLDVTKILKPRFVLANAAELTRHPMAMLPANVSISINQTHSCVASTLSDGLLDVDFPLPGCVAQSIRLDSQSVCVARNMTAEDVLTLCHRLGNHSCDITVHNRSSGVSERLAIVTADMVPAGEDTWHRTNFYAFVTVVVCGLIVLGFIRTSSPQRNIMHSPTGQLVAQPIKLSTTPCRPVRSRRYTPSRRRSSGGASPTSSSTSST